MSDKDKQPEPKTPMLPVEKTYGEKWHHFVFDTLINFWATLAISGLFTFWVKHSVQPLPQTFFKGKLPSEYHQWVRERFAKLGIVKMLPEAGQPEVAKVMADALSINLPGNVTILPSVWLGAKVKTPMVEWLDRRHYGPDADDDPRIAERHRIIETELKPTLLGATLARIGAMTASVFTGYAVGGGTNYIRRIKNPVTEDFPGFDHWAGQAGTSLGRTVAKASPKLNRMVDNVFAKPLPDGTKTRVDWTKAHGPTDATYNSALEGWMKFTALDVLYTTVTSSTVHPFMRLLHHVPFMAYRTIPLVTYRHKPEHDLPPERDSAPLVASADKAEPKREDTPDTKIAGQREAQRMESPEQRAQNV